jgi:Co/Zn/Cd efflux system component
MFRRVLWFALFINAGMFGVEYSASVFSDSISLKADALDFFGDAANYAISLFVASSSVLIRARASILKALTMGGFGIFVISTAVHRALYGSVPEATTMGLVGLLALVANLTVAAALFRYRTGDSNMRSVWLCSRNDAIGNLAVIVAALAVFASASRWPDLLVATIISTLAISSCWQILKLANREIQSQRATQT